MFEKLVFRFSKRAGPWRSLDTFPMQKSYILSFWLTQSTQFLSFFLSVLFSFFLSVCDCFPFIYLTHFHCKIKFKQYGIKKKRIFSFITLIPFSPHRKQQLTVWLTACQTSWILRLNCISDVWYTCITLYFWPWSLIVCFFLVWW